MGRIHIIGEQKGKDPLTDFNEIIQHEEAERSIANIEMWTARKVCEALMAEYKGWPWEVMCDARGHLVIVKCPFLSLTKGYHINMRNMTIEGLIRRAKRAAGEVLERHGMPRRRLTDSSIFDSLETDVKGDVVAPDAKGENPIKAVHH
jgi:hypothetical protein